jgi:hypothetical protein
MGKPSIDAGLVAIAAGTIACIAALEWTPVFISFALVVALAFGWCKWLDGQTRANFAPSPRN